MLCLHGKSAKDRENVKDGKNAEAAKKPRGLRLRLRKNRRRER